MTALNSNALFEALLKAAEESRLNGVFDKFLDTHINLSKTARSEASTSQRYLREFLKEENGRDRTFPPILEQNDSDFIAGSFGRHTKTWPLDDIDILFPLDGAKLLYFRGGVATPNTVVSDGNLISNPLLGPRWVIGNYISSDRLVAEFTGVLKRLYPRSDVAADGEATTVQLTIGASDESQGLNFDVVPCFRLEPFDGSAGFYLIPDGQNGWKHTNPRNDEAVCSKLQEYHGGRYRKVVKLLKYWNECNIDSALSSYYIELALANYFSSMLALGQRIPSTSQGVMLAFAALRSATLKGAIPSPVEYAPAVERGALTTAQDLKLNEAVSTTAHAVANESAGRVDQAIADWKKIFGSEFGE
jgi:hypothetical protein